MTKVSRWPSASTAANWVTSWLPGLSNDKGVLTSREGAIHLVPLVHLQIPATLCHNQLYIPLLELLDSGANANFLEMQLATQGSSRKFGLPPITVNALDGRFLAHITQYMAPLL